MNSEKGVLPAEYEEVSPEVISELTAIVGKGNILTEKHEIEDYACDEMPLGEPHPPQVVVKPADNQAISKLLAFANKKRIPVTKRIHTPETNHHAANSSILKK